MQNLAWLTKRMLWICGSVILVAEVITLLIYQPSWTGFGPDSTKNTERDGTGKVIKTVEVEQSSKTLWDWLSVLGVPLSLAILGFWLQQQEQRRVDAQAKSERDIAEGNQREEALQAYFDRLSTLLVDRNLIAVAAKVKKADETKEGQQDAAIDEQRELLNAARDVIRARTLSILRQFGEDGKRKSSVIQFLVEAEVIGKLNLNLRGADLDYADLSAANLSAVKLSSAKLNHALLFSANLSGANLNVAKLNHALLVAADLSGAHLMSTMFSNAHLDAVNLSGAVLKHAMFSDARLVNTILDNADLTGAKFLGADLSGARFINTILDGTDLSGAMNLTKEQLSFAKLCKTKLPKGCDLERDRDCEELGIQ